MKATPASSTRSRGVHPGVAGPIREPVMTRKMRALVKEGKSLSVKSVARPTVSADTQVVIQVRMAGLCRTDLFVAEGRIPARDPVVLGHEFAGIVDDAGSAVHGLKPGQPVTVMPWLPCQTCPQCQSGSETTCQQRVFLGIDCHGAFAEYIVVPARAVYPVPPTMPDKVAAYSEPVAAALSVLNAGLKPEQSGLIYGSNRFSVLLRAIMQAHGFNRITIYDPNKPGQGLEQSAYDFAIETVATTETLAEIVRATRPHGTVVLKSRQPCPVGINLITAVQKELTFRAVNYGSFTRSIAMLAEGLLDVDELLGPVYSLEEYEQAFADSRHNETTKVFMSLGAP